MLSMKLADVYLPIIVTDCVSTTYRQVQIGQKLDSVWNSKALCGVLTCVAGMLSMKLADVYLPIIVTDCVSTTFRVWPMKLHCQLKRNRGGGLHELSLSEVDLPTHSHFYQQFLSAIE